MKASDFLDAQLGTAEPAQTTVKTRSAKDFLDEQLGKTESGPPPTTPSAPAKTTVAAPAAPTDFARVPAGAGAALAQGLAGAAGTPGTVRSGLLGLLDRAIGVPGLGDSVMKALATGPALSRATAALPTVPQTLGAEKAGEQSALSAAGLPANYLAPQGAGERYLQAGARGLGGALPLLGLGPVGAVASGIGGGLGSQGGEDLFPGSTVAPIIGGLAGGGLGQGAASVVQRLTSPSLASLAHTIGSAGRDSSTYAVPSIEEAGMGLQTAGKQYLTQHFPEEQSKVWAPIDAAIDPTLPVELNNYKGALKSMIGDLGPLGKSGDRLFSTVKAKQLLGDVDGMPDITGNPTWSQLATFRTQLGNRLSGPIGRDDLNQQQMKQVYAALTSDMRTAAHAQGVGDAFDTANAQSKALFDTADKVQKIAKINPDDLNVTSSAPAKVAEKLIRDARSGGSDLNTLRDAHPVLDDAVNQLAAAHINPVDSGTKLPLFHQLSQEGQSALMPYGKLRQQAAEASARIPGPTAADISHVPVLSIMGTDWGRAGAEAMGLGQSTVGGLALAGAAAPYVIKNAKAIAGKPATLAGPALGADEGYDLSAQPDLVVRPRPVR